MKFEQFDFHPAIMADIRTSGYVTPTPIQAQAIPSVLAGRDVMGLAQTGTGKTAAFVLPILQRLMQGGRRRIRALILAPTRELAEQIHQAIGILGRSARLSSVTLYGGVSMTRQTATLRSGAEIAVACPGRLLDHIGQGSIDLTHLEVLVLDEADQMFDMGFLPDIRRILGHLPRRRQTLLFSATMPEAIRGLTREVLSDPVTVQVGRAAPAATVTHAIYPVAQHLKTALLLELIGQTQNGSVLVFTRTKHRAKRLGEQLAKAGHPAASLQGNLSQNRRQEAMDGFRNGSYRILAATDIAARGIDVSLVSHVINYDIPATAETYIHRIGRTGRAERSGDAFTLATPEDMAMVGAIERLLGAPLERRWLPGFDTAAPPPLAEAVRTSSGQPRLTGNQGRKRPASVSSDGAQRPERRDRQGRPSQGRQG